MSDPSTVATPVTLRSLIPTAFLPSVTFGLSGGAIAPVLVLTAINLGASPGRAAFTVSLLGIGLLVGELPSGWFAQQVGERRAMLYSSTVALAALIAAPLVRSVILLEVAIFVVGMTNATFALARQAYIAQNVPPLLRARAMSSLGGSNRIGSFAGPFAGAAAIALFDLRAAYWVAVAATVITMVVLLVVPDLPGADSGARRAKAQGVAVVTVGLRDIFRSHWRVVATLGWGIFFMTAVRASRQIVLPLWANHLGLNAAQTSLIFGIASAVDMSLFYPAGKIMDRFGRLAIAVPGNALNGIGVMLLPLTQNTLWFVVVAMVLSAGNGLTAGIGMTLGADVAPAEGKVRFLSVWRLMADAGNAFGPVAVSAVTAAAALSLGIVSVGSFGVLAALAFAYWAPKYSPLATLAGVRRHREEAAVEAEAQKQLSGKP
ncbi:putative MFS family arabinose efflux permease [Asanoa ferruginea]|uniref:Putative MFS family arabinose efflux permease n=1 Tax=Asanoa ferruginea TaxID=53367 RepID=A0A3D9ZRE8_9ACTN|nr:MFS transporter [Asanoa ferruginea]REF99781.1 putative MFS family arabinose efflux permease [Asanoa ferruginea]GIF52492.1 MFS transporter [Asanoa ferruginea]